MTLLMRDQENIEKGIQKGIEKGLQKGLQKGKIYGAITAYQDLDLHEDVILQKLQIKFHLTEEEVKEYLQDLNNQRWIIKQPGHTSTLSAAKPDDAKSDDSIAGKISSFRGRSKRLFDVFLIV